jgi:alpha-D-xyloside xylohydrolase
MQLFETAKDAITWRGDGETLVVQAWGRDSLRVRSTRAGEVLRRSEQERHAGRHRG